VALPSTPAGRALLGARTALGISTLLAPRLAGKAFLLDPDANPQLPVIGRMWGIRNLSLAAGMYAATGANRAQWWRLQPGVDALDFLASRSAYVRASRYTTHRPHPAAGIVVASIASASTTSAQLERTPLAPPLDGGCRAKPPIRASRETVGEESLSSARLMPLSHQSGQSTRAQHGGVPQHIDAPED